MDAHLESVVGIGTLTVGRLSDHKLKDLGGHTDGALDYDSRLGLSLKGLVLKIGAHLLYGLDVGRRKGDSNSVDGRGRSILRGIDLLYDGKEREISGLATNREF